MPRYNTEYGTDWNGDYIMQYYWPALDQYSFYNALEYSYPSCITAIWKIKNRK